MKRISMIAILLAAMSVATYAQAEIPDPELIFNCDLPNEKGVVIRLKDNVPTYYYGSIEQVEMTLPRIEGDKTQVRVGEMTFAGGGSFYYRFINGNFSYVVYSGMGRGWEFTGLKVYQGKKRIMKRECTNGGFLNTNYRGENLVKESDTGDDDTYGYAD